MAREPVAVSFCRESGLHGIGYELPYRVLPPTPKAEAQRQANGNWIQADLFRGLGESRAVGLGAVKAGWRGAAGILVIEGGRAQGGPLALIAVLLFLPPR